MRYSLSSIFVFFYIYIFILKLRVKKWRGNKYFIVFNGIFFNFYGLIFFLCVRVCLELLLFLKKKIIKF